MAEYYVDSNKEVTLLAGATDNHYNANISFDNINDTARNIANWSNNITNCITYIPQDIKLELNNGTLTLKAGSKLYVPNGFEGTTPKFDVINIENDASKKGDTNRNCITIVRNNFTSLLSLPSEYGYSGANAPTVFYASKFAFWYDTTNNKMKCTVDAGVNWEEVAFPFGQMTETTDGYTSIDQIFNGFGYIGSTVFALPGVKGLIPNGRNADGTLKSIPFEVQNVKTRTFTSGDNNFKALGFDGESFIVIPDSVYYDSDNNFIMNNDSPVLSCQCGVISNSSGKITYLNPKNTFHALDYNDTSYISTQSCPSDRYIDLSLLASGSTYTAPANGWFFFSYSQQAGTYTGSIFTNRGAAGLASQTRGVINGYSCLNIKALKGNVVALNYDSNPGGNIIFRFIYDEGEV